MTQITGSISEATPSKKHARFAMYARLVRSLDVPTSFVIDPTVLAHFFTLVRTRYGSTHAMLPSLRSFTYAASPAMTPIVLELICRPPVRRVSLSLHGDWSVYSSDIGCVFLPYTMQQRPKFNLASGTRTMERVRRIQIHG